MSKIKGIYAASMSILNDDLSLNIKKTIQHAENVIDNGCHGAAIFGSTGQAQLIPISEKINLLNHLISSKYKEKYFFFLDKEFRFHKLISCDFNREFRSPTSSQSFKD